MKKIWPLADIFEQALSFNRKIVIYSSPRKKGNSYYIGVQGVTAYRSHKFPKLDSLEFLLMILCRRYRNQYGEQIFFDDFVLRAWDV